ncbi:hypothetical protein [Streptomyces sp. NPDC126514]|uniref:hypothetical protein n=1 Tax=Streptomyces sp. NPDC126514 TaxID=3155210 RepID=UPI00332042A4
MATACRGAPHGGFEVLAPVADEVLALEQLSTLPQRLENLDPEYGDRDAERLPASLRTRA